MKMQWQKICVKTAIWLVTEIILNLLGLDNLADYSEFIFEKHVAIQNYQPQIAVVAQQQPPQFSHNFRTYPVTLPIVDGALAFA